MAASDIGEHGCLRHRRAWLILAIMVRLLGLLQLLSNSLKLFGCLGVHDGINHVRFAHSWVDEKIYLINHVSAETRTTERVIEWELTISHKIVIASIARCELNSNMCVKR